MTNANRIMTLMLLIVVGIFPAVAEADGEDKESFEKLSDKLDRAIEARDFHVAREAIEELIPMMKDELKKHKKLLSGLKKEDSPDADPEEYARKLERKTELYESLKDLVDISPAALRVKSERIQSDVQEFIDLS